MAKTSSVSASQCCCVLLLHKSPNSNCFFYSRDVISFYLFVFIYLFIFGNAELTGESESAPVQRCFWETGVRLQPVSLSHSPPNKHPLLFSWGHVAAGATGPCQGEITSYRWRLSPVQGSRVTVGGGSGATSSRAIRRLPVCWGQVWALLSRHAALDLMEHQAQPLTRLAFHQLGLFSAAILYERRKRDGWLSPESPRHLTAGEEIGFLF